MPDSEPIGKKSADQVQQPRPRPAKLERIRQRNTQRERIDRELDRAWSEWETTFDAIQDSIMLLDSKFNIIQANATTSRLLGRPLDEIIGNKCCRLVHETDAPPEGCPLSKAASAKKRHKTELYIPQKDMWTVVSVDPILDEQGNLTGAVHIIRDITDRKKADEALRESEEHFRNIFENALLGLYRTTPEGRILMANPALVRMLGYASVEELARRNLEDEGFEPDYPRSIFKERIEADGQIVGLESAWIRRDGTTLFVRESATAVRDAGGNILYYEGTVEDITDRKKAEEAYKTLVDHSLQGLIVFQDGRVAFANQTMARITGYSVDEMLALPPEKVQAFVHPEDRETVWSRYEKRLSGATVPEHYECRGIRKNGQLCSLEIHASLVDYQGRPAIQAAFVDITERKEAAEALRTSENRLALAIECTGMGLWDQDFRTGRITRNDTWMTMLGYEPDEINPDIKSFHELVHPNDMPRLLECAKAHKAGLTGVFDVEHRLRAKSAQWRWIRNFGRIVERDEQGNPLRAVGVHLDITERKMAEEALQESIRLLRDTGEMAEVGGWELDLSTKEVSWTEEVGRIHGVEPGYKPNLEEALDFYAPESRPDVERAVKRAAETGEPYDIESLFIPRGRKDEIWVRSLGKAVYSAGKIVKLAGTFQNIDKYKRAEETLREATQTLDAVIKASPLPIFAVDRERIVKAWNPAAERTFGWSAQEIVGRPYPAIPKEKMDEADALFSRALESGLTEVETLRQRKDGSLMDVSISAAPLRDSRGNITGVMAVITDITERKKAEKDLREQRDIAQKYLDVAGVMIHVLDGHGIIRLMNKKGCEILGLPEAEIIGRNWFDSFVPEQAKAAVKTVFRRLMAGETRPVEYIENPILTKNGARKLIAWHNTVLRNENGDIIGILSSGEDITERKKAEQELMTRQAQLKTLTSELALAEELERRRVAMGIHDDIGQKLAMAKLELQLLIRSLGDSALSASLGSICEKIDAVVEDAHSLTFELSNPALYELSFDAAIEQWLFEQIEKKHGIKCRVASYPERVELGTDLKVLLFRAIRELAVNVVKYAKATALRVNIKKGKDRILISVKDDGVGFVPPEAGAFLLNDEGGFGLFNIRERLEYLGGGMKIQSTPGHGTRITLTAPLQQRNSTKAQR